MKIVIKFCGWVYMDDGLSTSSTARYNERINSMLYPEKSIHRNTQTFRSCFRNTEKMLLINGWIIIFNLSLWQKRKQIRLN